MNADKNVPSPPISPLSQTIWGAAVLLVLALVVRALVYFRLEDILHAEEAVQGLIARHILQREIQLFTYGLPYLGTLQAHWIALCFALLGPTTIVLKWAAGLESLLLVPASYLLAREGAGGDRRAGFLAALLTAVGPLYLIEWSLRPRGGHLEVATLSALAFWALLRAFRAANAEEATGGTAPQNARPRMWLCLSAFFLGVGWWVHLTMLYAMVASVIALVIWGKRLRTDLRAVVPAIVCFLIGSLPFWLYNAKYPGRTFQYLWHVVWTGWHGPGPFARLVETAQFSIPILLGSRQTEAGQSFGLAVVLLALAAYVIAILAAIGATRNRTAGASDDQEKTNTTGTGVGLLLIFSAIAFAVFILGPFSEQALDPQSLLPLYGALPALAAIGLARWWSEKTLGQYAAVGLVAVMLIVHLVGYRSAERAVVQPFAYEKRVPLSLEPLRLFLDTNRITRVFTNFHLGYRLTFETGERVIACTDGDPFPERYPPYAEEVRKSDGPVAFIVGSRMAVLLQTAMKARGIASKDTPIQELHVVQPLNARYTDYPPTGVSPYVPAAIEVGDYPRQCPPGESFAVKVAVTNRSSVAWPVLNDSCIVALSYHLLDPGTGKMVRYDNPRFSMGSAVEPGQSVSLTMKVEAPREPGRYAFVPDLVIEGLAWFSTGQSALLDKPNWHEFSVVAGR